VKIAYIIEEDVSYESGVLKKLAAQMQAWLGEGHQVKFFALSPKLGVWSGLNIAGEVILSPIVLTNQIRAVKLVKPIESWQPDIVYMRLGLYNPSWIKIAASFPIVIEVNSDDLSERKASHNYHSWLYHRLTRNIFFRKVGGMVFVTHELADKFNQYTQPKIVISNGIDLTQYYPLPAPSNSNPRLVFSATNQSVWHGIDKVYQMAEHFRDWQFDLIGNLDLPPEYAINNLPNIKLYGRLARDQYESLMAAADIGIGSLSLHHNNMQEACVLKVREYLAYGIPTIIGYRDTDFLTSAPFLLQIPNTPDSIQKSLIEIKSFVEQWKGKRLDRNKINHLDARSKEKQRLGFFEQILNNIFG